MLLLLGCNVKGFRSSFVKPHFGENNRASVGDIVCDVAADKAVFNVKEVELEFYYGNILSQYDYHRVKKEIEYTDEDDEAHQLNFVTFALFFMHKDNKHFGFQMPEMEEDYKDISNSVYIKEIAYDDFYSENYQVETGIRRLLGSPNLYYTYSERIAVSSEVFDKEKNNFSFCICAIYYNEYLEKFAIVSQALLVLYYKYIDQNTVKLALNELDLD